MTQKYERARKAPAQPVNEPAGEIPAGPRIPQCQATKADGVRCGSPALRGKPLCYFHGRPKPKPRLPEPPPVLPNLRSPEQMLRWTLANLATRRIDNKTAGQLIYAIQQLM